MDSVLGVHPNHRIKELLNIGFRKFNIKSSCCDFQILKNADEKEEKMSKAVTWEKSLSSGEKSMPKRVLEAFRDNTAIMSINIKNLDVSQDKINDHIDPRRLKKLTLIKGDSTPFKDSAVEEYLSKNTFPELRNLLLQHFGTVSVNWSFPTMPQLETLDMSFIDLSGEELDIIFSRVKIIRMRGINYLLALRHLEQSTVVCDFTLYVSIVVQIEELFQQLVRLLNSNNTLKSLTIRSHRCEDMNFYNPLPLIHNTTLESLTIYHSTFDEWADPFAILCQRWIGSNLKTFVTPPRVNSSFTAELAHQIQSSFPKLENIFFHGGDIDAFGSYILRNHNLKTLTLGMNFHLNSSILGCLHSIQNLTFYSLSVDSLIQILSMQSPALKSLEIKSFLSCISPPEIIESLALAIRDNQHLTHLSFAMPPSGFSNDSQFIKFLTPIIEGNRSLLSLEIDYYLSKDICLIDSTQSNLFKQSILGNLIIQRLKISRYLNSRELVLGPTVGALVTFIKSQSICTTQRIKI